MVTISTISGHHPLIYTLEFAMELLKYCLPAPTLLFDLSRSSHF